MNSRRLTGAGPLLDDLSSLLAAPPRRATLSGAVPAVRPLLAALLFERIDAPLLVVTADAAAAEAFHRCLALFLPPEARPLLFPAWEVLPFEPLSTAPAVSATRIATLAALRESPRPIVVSPVESVLQLLVPPALFAGARIDVSPGRRMDWRGLRRQLAHWGYEQVERVESVGQCAHRGGIFDVFTPGVDDPVRIELFGDEVASLHCFDPTTQRSRRGIPAATLLPAREVVIDSAAARILRRHLAAVPEAGGADGIEDLAAIPGIECYQAAVRRSKHDILDYFPAPPVVVVSEFADLEERARRLEAELAEGASRALIPALADPARSYHTFDRWHARLDETPLLYFDLFGLSPSGIPSRTVESTGGRSFVQSLRAETGGAHPLRETARGLTRLQETDCVLFFTRSGETAGRLAGLGADAGLGVREIGGGEARDLLRHPRPGAPRVVVGELQEGFRLPGAGLAVLAEEDIFGAKAAPAAPTARAARGLWTDFRRLKPGDFLVHVDHGIGRFLELTRLAAGKGATECILIEYDGGDRLYIPVHNLDRVQRYVAPEGSEPRLSRLGGRGWSTARRRVKKALLTMARDLIDLYARRREAPGHAFSPDTPWQREFEMSFAYPETEDQLRAVSEIKDDMERDRPMDRLVCGDVGYGKTEVALRAVFKSLMDHKQAAVLAPTTLLAEQHLSVFRQRFGPYPVRVEMLSRFVGSKKQRGIVDDLAKGAVDVVIGTHRLLGRDVRFHDLGLVVIDEEQRFGVRHKEALKKLRCSVDVLALTATPIPRTLHLSLSGIRDLSLIATPPEERLAIRTTVAKFSREVIAGAIRRELRRGGQVYFIHNRIGTLPAVAALLRDLVPEARLGIAHGRMKEAGLEEVMNRFRGGDIDVLVSTAIVESGLDIPAANTMIVNRADRFGLADLYQLRGRIGRSARQAYAVLLLPDEAGMTPTARRRVEVLRENSHLGAGFQIAAYDLELRGSGSVVGYRQSGHIAAIGFELYTDLLRRTVAELQGAPVPEERPMALRLPFPSFLPGAYVPETNERLDAYKRIAGAREGGELDELERELRERFGPLPDEARSLLLAARLKIEGQSRGVERIEWDDAGLRVLFHRGAVPGPEALARAVSGGGPGSRVRGDGTVVWAWRSTDPGPRFDEAAGLLRRLG